MDFMRPLLLTLNQKPCAIAFPKDSFAGGEIGCGVKLRAVMEELNNQEGVYNMRAIFRRFAQMEEILYGTGRGDTNRRGASLLEASSAPAVHLPKQLLRSKSAPAPVATKLVETEKVAGDKSLEDLINEQAAEDSLQTLTKRQEEEALKSLETGSLDDDDFDLELPSGKEASQLLQEMKNLKNLRPELLQANYIVRPVLLHPGPMELDVPSTTIHCPTNDEDTRGRHSVLADLL